MPEVQKHGFIWEKDLIRNVYGATDKELKAIKYTNKIDLPSNLNRLDGVCISIKTYGSKNAVCMGYPIGVYDSVSSGKPIHMTVIQYEQDEITCIKKLISITEVNLTNSVRLLFGSLTRQQIEELDKIVKSVPGKQSPTPEQYEAMYSVRNSLQPLAAAIHLDIKCDSEQSRIQCSFNHFHDFLKNNPDRIIAHSTTGNFRGKKVIEELASPPRKKSKNYPEKCHWREIQKKEPLLVLTKAGLPKKNSKDNKEIVKRYPFTPLPAPDSAPHSPPL